MENWLREIVENAAEIEEYKIGNGKNGNRKIRSAENTKSEIGTAENMKSEIPKNENQRIRKGKWKIGERERERERERETYLLPEVAIFSRRPCRERERERERERQREREREREKERVRGLIYVFSHFAFDSFFSPLPSLTWHRMSSFAVHISVCALLAVDLDNSKGGSGFGRFSKGHDVR